MVAAPRDVTGCNGHRRLWLAQLCERAVQRCAWVHGWYGGLPAARCGVRSGPLTLLLRALPRPHPTLAPSPHPCSIGPELVASAMRVLKASHAPLAFEIVDNIIDEVRAHMGILSYPACCAAAPHAPSIQPLPPPSPQLTPEALSSCRRTGCILKGEFNTGIGKGTKPSINVELRKSLALFANVVHPFNIPGIASRHDNVDIVIVRENMEGEFSGMEHEVVPGVAESLKVMTRDATRRIAQYAFEYAFLNNRAKVTAVHKANIMKKVRGGKRRRWMRCSSVSWCR